MTRQASSSVVEIANHKAVMMLTDMPRQEGSRAVINQTFSSAFYHNPYTTGPQGSLGGAQHQLPHLGEGKAWRRLT